MHDKTCECTTHAAKSEFWRRLVFDNEDGRCYYKYRTSSAVSERFKQEEKAPKRFAFWHGTLFKLQARQKIETSEHKKEKQESQQSNSTTN